MSAQRLLALAGNATIAVISSAAMISCATDGWVTLPGEETSPGIRNPLEVAADSVKESVRQAGESIGGIFGDPTMEPAPETRSGSKGNDIAALPPTSSKVNLASNRGSPLPKLAYRGRPAEPFVFERGSVVSYPELQPGQEVPRLAPLELRQRERYWLAQAIDGNSHFTGEDLSTHGPIMYLLSSGSDREAAASSRQLLPHLILSDNLDLLSPVIAHVQRITVPAQWNNVLRSLAAHAIVNEHSKLSAWVLREYAELPSGMQIWEWNRLVPLHLYAGRIDEAMAIFESNHVSPDRPEWDRLYHLLDIRFPNRSKFSSHGHALPEVRQYFVDLGRHFVNHSQFEPRARRNSREIYGRLGRYIALAGYDDLLFRDALRQVDALSNETHAVHVADRNRRLLDVMMQVAVDAGEFEMVDRIMSRFVPVVHNHTRADVLQSAALRAVQAGHRDGAVRLSRAYLLHVQGLRMDMHAHRSARRLLPHIVSNALWLNEPMLLDDMAAAMRHVGGTFFTPDSPELYAPLYVRDQVDIYRSWEREFCSAPASRRGGTAPTFRSQFDAANSDAATMSDFALRLDRGNAQRMYFAAMLYSRHADIDRLVADLGSRGKVSPLFAAWLDAEHLYFYLDALHDQVDRPGAAIMIALGLRQQIDAPWAGW